VVLLVPVGEMVGKAKKLGMRIGKLGHVRGRIAD
jgi:hypothetical protein